MIWLALAMEAVWLLAISFALASLIKHVATLQLAREAGPLPLVRPDFDHDGPDVGVRVPPDLMQILYDRGGPDRHAIPRRRGHGVVPGPGTYGGDSCCPGEPCDGGNGKRCG